MVNVSVARRYARALLESVVATEAPVSAQVRKLGENLVTLASQSRELASALSDAGTPPDRRRQMLDQLSRTLALDAGEVKGFLRHLLERGRFVPLSELRQAFHQVVAGGATEQVSAQLEALMELVRRQPELRSFFTDPTYTSAQQRAVIDALIQTIPIDAEPLPRFLRLLVDRRRLAALPDIARVFRDLADEREGRVRGKVVSAAPLPADALRNLESVLESLTRSRVLLQTEVNPSVLGGVSAQVGSVLYDGTLRTELEEIRRALKR
ncbi:MAG TPA: ATP synthase F1 subunit delta [Myxococcaceae bacterium]|nr:ATP synthase F1 subunit delta [Myxococcaceae bacterium]